MSLKGLRCCVVGSGPAGMYSTAFLHKYGAASIHIKEKLSVPFGLVRSGIAPDHVHDRLVSNEFDKLLQLPGVQLSTGVNVGTHESLSQLQQQFDIVVLAYGMQRDRLLGAENEEKAVRGVYAARQFAAWYNGCESASGLRGEFERELRDAESCAVVGNGNVALDVARLLVKEREAFVETSIDRAALRALRRSAVRHVHIIGRRGIPHVSFTNRELREILQLPNCDVDVVLDEPLSEQQVAQMKATRQSKRQLPMWQKVIAASNDAKTKPYRITFHFNRSVHRFVLDSASRRVTSVELARNALDSETQRARRTDVVEPLRDVPLVFRAIGFGGESVSEQLPMSSAGVVENDRGRVKGMRGVYVAGWLKRGPSGIVGTNRFDAEETIQSVVQDFKSNT